MVHHINHHRRPSRILPTLKRFKYDVTQSAIVNDCYTTLLSKVSALQGAIKTRWCGSDSHRARLFDALLCRETGAVVAAADLVHIIGRPQFHTKYIFLHGHNERSYADALVRAISEVNGYRVVMDNYCQLESVIVPVLCVLLQGELGNTNHALVLVQPKYAMDVEDLLNPWFRPGNLIYQLQALSYPLCDSELTFVAQRVTICHEKGKRGLTFTTPDSRIYHPNTTCKTLYEHVLRNENGEMSHDNGTETPHVCVVHCRHRTQIVRYGGQFYYVKPSNTNISSWTVLSKKLAEQLVQNMRSALSKFHEVTGRSFGDVAERNMVVDETLTNIRLIDFGNVGRSTITSRTEDNVRLDGIISTVNKYIDAVE